MTVLDSILFLSILAGGILVFFLSVKRQKRKKNVAPGEDSLDVFLRHLDSL